MVIVHLWWWIQRVTGGSNVSGVAYGEWSGFLSDISEFLILGGVIGLYRKHNCHVKGCPRIGKHPVGQYVVCKKHHPGTPQGDITPQHIQLAYNKEEEVR